jgi:hypothetical protein
LDPKVNFKPGSRLDPYVVGGGGYYRRTVQFTAPTAAPTLIFDPFFGYFYNALVPVNQVLGTITRDGAGGSLGAGFDFGMSHGTTFFTEARYVYAGTGSLPTRVVPVTFGFRW